MFFEDSLLRSSSSSSDIFELRYFRTPIFSSSDVFELRYFRAPMFSNSDVFELRYFRAPIFSSSDVFELRCFRTPEFEGEHRRCEPSIKHHAPPQEGHYNYLIN